MSQTGVARLSSITLRVPDSEVQALKCFYTQVIGMEHISSLSGDEKFEMFKIPQHHPRYLPCIQKHNSIDLKFLIKSDLKSYDPAKDDLYWKIGFCLNDVSSAVDTLNNAIERESRELSQCQYKEIGHGSQFFDIGFMTHLRDPSNFSIELLQTTFEDNVELRQNLIHNLIKQENEIISTLKMQEDQKLPMEDETVTKQSSLLFCQPFVIGQITTRITDPAKSLEFYTNVLKMKLLSIQEVTKYRFTLYFLGYTEDIPPNEDDLTDVKNREWLWQRKYTTLELQWRWDSKSLRQGSDESGGLESIEVEIHRTSFNSSNLLQNLEKHEKFCPFSDEKSIDLSDGGSIHLHGMIQDPDGLKINIISRSSKGQTYEA